MSILSLVRFHDRAFDQLRPVKITEHVFPNASGSVLFEIGSTKVYCAVTLSKSVPPFLKGTKMGWLTAEYALLPVATHTRTAREVASCKRNGRTIEISRLIGRSLRTVVDLSVLAEHTITIDCDVFQADGGTRTAAITGACLALRLAELEWLKKGIIKMPLLSEDIAAISVGAAGDTLLLDLDYAEDTKVDADFNFVLTRSGKIIEIQGCAEKKPLSVDAYHAMHALAFQGVKSLFDSIDSVKAT